MQNDNLAYAIKRFEDIEETSNEKKVEIVKVAKAKKKPAQKSAWKLLMTMVYITALCSALIFAKVDLTEANAKVLDLVEEMREIESETVRLDLELQALISLKNVEEIAKNDIGLSETNQSQIEYISIKDENKVQIINDEKDYLEYISQFFGEVKEYIMG